MNDIPNWTDVSDSDSTSDEDDDTRKATHRMSTLAQSTCNTRGDDDVTSAGGDGVKAAAPNPSDVEHRNEVGNNKGASK